MIPNPFSKLPVWLVRGIQLRNDQVPNNLNIETVTPVIDILQGGWGVAQGVVNNVAIAASTAFGTSVIEPANQTEFWFVITGMEIVHTGTAVTTVPAVSLTFTRDSGQTLTYGRWTPGPDVTLTSQEIMKGAPYILCPPGQGMRWGTPATGLLETFSLQMNYFRIPAGAKPF